MLENSFIQVLIIWQDKNKKYLLDGVHRLKVLKELQKENHIVPDELPAIFVDCKDKKEASKFVLTYSSKYANITDEGLYEFLNVNELIDDFESIKAEIDLPEIDLKEFEKGWIEEENTQQSKNLQEKYLIPPFSIFDTRQGYWQDRKRQWLSLGIKSELGRGGR